MTCVVFAGPSLHGTMHLPAGIEFRPPAARGDIVRAVADGAKRIGLIDGYFGSCASVWHKEILYALSTGCQVYGAASMGALRAAECHPFGMFPIGAIAMDFMSGALRDDAEVALVHGPSEVDYLPFTEALVDARATFRAMRDQGVIDRTDHDALLQSAVELHFSARTPEAIAENADIVGPSSRLAELYEQHRVRAKKADAVLLVQTISSGPASLSRTRDWQLEHSASLVSLLLFVEEERSPALARRV